MCTLYGSCTVLFLRRRAENKTVKAAFTLRPHTTPRYDTLQYTKQHFRPITLRPHHATPQYAAQQKTECKPMRNHVCVHTWTAIDGTTFSQGILRLILAASASQELGFGIIFTFRCNNNNETIALVNEPNSFVYTSYINRQ